MNRCELFRLAGSLREFAKLIDVDGESVATKRAHVSSFLQLKELAGHGDAVRADHVRLPLMRKRQGDGGHAIGRRTAEAARLLTPPME